jgi:Ca2+/Na+ antiporter
LADFRTQIFIPFVQVDSITVFSRQSQIPPFFVSFVVTPFASNASELVSSLLIASKKQSKKISLTFAQVTGPCPPALL